MLKKLIISICITAFIIDVAQCSPNRNIIWNNNSCWINSGLQCMTTFYDFRSQLDALDLQENSLEFLLKTTLNELTTPQNSPIDTSNFYAKSVSCGIGAMGTGGGDFVPSILSYLLTNRIPQLKNLFRQVLQIKEESTIKILSAKARNAQAQIQKLRAELVPEIKKIPFSTPDEKLKSKRQTLVNELSSQEANLNKIIQDETVELSKFEYRIAYYWSIKSFKEITEQGSSLVVFPKYLLLNFCPGFNEEIPLTIKPYGCNKKYHLQAKGLSSHAHATSVVKSDTDNNWYFYDDLGKKIIPVDANVIKNKKYNNYSTDFLYYQTEDTDDIFVDSNKNMTPLHWAALCQNVSMAQELIKNGALIDAKTTTLETPLHFAALSGSVEIIKLLLQNKAKISIENAKRMSPLSFALEQFNCEAAKYLMQCGANINQTYHASGKLSLSHLISVTSLQNKEVSFKIIKFIIAHNLTNDVLQDAMSACSKNNSAELRNQIALLLNTNPIGLRLTLLNKRLLTIKKELSILMESLEQLKTKLS